MEARELLAFLAIRHNGDWNKIYDDIKGKYDVDSETLKEALKTLNCNYITIMDEKYPQGLKNSFKPPFVLFYYGNIDLLSSDNIVSIISGRYITDYSKNALKEALRNNYKDNVILTTLNAGAGYEATCECKLNGQKQIVVLASGIDYCYPHNENTIRLYNSLKSRKEETLIISEYPNEVLPTTETMAQRTRLLGSGIIDKVLLVEAQKQSGSVVAIQNALNNNKDIVVIPQPYNSESVNNQLIYDGAEIFVLEKE